MVPPIPVPALVRVFIVGVVIVALGCAITPFVGAGFGLVVSLGLLAAIGSGAGSFSVLIGAATQQLPAQSQGTASGIINAGGSFGQFVFAPIMQKLIQSVGWMGAMRSEEHTSELQSLMRISYAVFCLKKKKNIRYSL